MTRRRLLSELIGLTGLAVGSGCQLVELRARGLSRRLERQDLRYELLDVGDGMRIGCWAAPVGDREPVLLLHGFGASGMWQWSEQVPVLIKAGYAPIIPDLLWFGQSTDERRDYRVVRQVTAMIAVLDTLGIQRAHVAGISYGGIVAHDLCVRARSRFHTATLISSPARAFLADDQAPLLAHYGVSTMADLLLPTTPAEVSRLFEIAYAHPPKLPKGLRRQVVEYFYQENVSERQALLDAIVGSIGELRTLEWVPDQPTLIVWGREDRVFPVLASERLRDELGMLAHLVIIDDAGHAPNLERPKQVNQVLVDFLLGSPMTRAPV